MIKWTRTSRLSIQNSLSLPSGQGDCGARSDLHKQKSELCRLSRGKRQISELCRLSREKLSKYKKRSSESMPRFWTWAFVLCRGRSERSVHLPPHKSSTTDRGFISATVGLIRLRIRRVGDLSDCEDRVLDGPASGKTGSTGRN